MKQIRKQRPSDSRVWYNTWVDKNAFGTVLDVGKSTYWNYDFPTIDTNKDMEPTWVMNVENTDFRDDQWDVVLCNGMYEFVDDPQKMIDEVQRIGKSGIFGFVCKGYRPYRKPWRFYEGKETIRYIEDEKTFQDKYHFIIWKK